MTATMPAMTEKDFQRQVLDLARILGWHAYHAQLSKWSEKGWPDLTLVRGERLIFAELKRDGGKLTPAQEVWIGLLGGTRAEVYVWRPADLEAIAEVLR